MIGKKENVIEKKIQNKPSFKNLINIEKERVPESRSKSKSRSNFKKKSRKKISAISPPKSTTSIGRHFSTPSIEDEREPYQRTTSQKQLRKNKKNQINEIMKKIINMKNKVTTIEKSINQQLQKATKIQEFSQQNNEKNKEEQLMEKFKVIKDFLGDYDVQIKSQTTEIKNSYIQTLQQYKKSQIQEFQIPQAKLIKADPGMPTLAKKLAQVNQLLG